LPIADRSAVKLRLFAPAARFKLVRSADGHAGPERGECGEREHMAEQYAGRPEAAAAIWVWRAAPPAPKPATGRTRVRGVLQASVGLAVAGTLLWLGHATAATVVASVACAIGLAALLSPLGLFAAIERAFTTLGGWIGTALTWILLPFVFYVFFVPFGALFRRGRRDSMQRFFDPDATTYWTPRGTRSGRTASSSHERHY
jgi:hypothetical protein